MASLLNASCLNVVLKLGVQICQSTSRRAALLRSIVAMTGKMFPPSAGVALGSDKTLGTSCVALASLACTDPLHPLQALRGGCLPPQPGNMEAMVSCYCNREQYF